MQAPKVFTILALCLFALAATAQKEATVKSFTLTTNMIQGNDRRNDLNGVPCALVKIQVTDDVARVEGNKIGDIIKNGVEKWVYMCNGSRNMKIHFKNYTPITLMFKDYGINGLESNRVYELVIKITDAPSAQPVAEEKTDVILLNDSSFVLCEIIKEVKAYVLFRQKENANILKLPIKEIYAINYSNGTVKKFNNSRRRKKR